MKPKPGPSAAPDHADRMGLHSQGELQPSPGCRVQSACSKTVGTTKACSDGLEG